MNNKLKNILYVTFFLLLPLVEAGWGLTSCRTKNTAVSEKSDSVALHAVHLSDSMAVDTRLQFDKLDIWYMDSVPLDSLSAPARARIIKHVCITGGSLTKTKTKTKTEHLVDSVSICNEKHSEPIFTPPKPNKWLVITILSVLLFFVIAGRTRMRDCASAN